MAKRKWKFEFTHKGYIAEDHDHVKFDGKGEITEGDGNGLTNLTLTEIKEG